MRRLRDELRGMPNLVAAVAFARRRLAVARTFAANCVDFVNENAIAVMVEIFSNQSLGRDFFGWGKGPPSVFVQKILNPWVPTNRFLTVRVSMASAESQEGVR